MRQAQEYRCGVVIPTLNAGPRWLQCLAALAGQSLPLHRKFVVDSQSTDETVALALQAGFEARQIARSEFSHGGTRQAAAEYLSDCDIVIFLTQDAVLANVEALSELVSSFDDPSVAVAYGRQLPHPCASAIETHARLFNYCDASQRKDLKASAALGAKVFFCSNSFAAYRRVRLLALGGFRRDLIMGEDAEFAARAILAGFANFYCATALVYHSHDYDCTQLFCRYFDTGVFHARNPWLAAIFGSYGGEGLRFVRSELRYLARRAPQQMPVSMLRTLAKAVGYRFGRAEKYLPRALKTRLSMTPSYWRPTRQGTSPLELGRPR